MLGFFLDLLDEEKFMVELVVQCIRSSDVPQTHHHALLLLGTAATIFPVSDVMSCSLPEVPIGSLTVFSFSRKKCC